MSTALLDGILRLLGKYLYAFQRESLAIFTTLVPNLIFNSACFYKEKKPSLDQDIKKLNMGGILCK